MRLKTHGAVPAPTTGIAPTPTAFRAPVNSPFADFCTVVGEASTVPCRAPAMLPGATIRLPLDADAAIERGGDPSTGGGGGGGSDAADTVPAVTVWNMTKRITVEYDIFMIFVPYNTTLR